MRKIFKFFKRLAIRRIAKARNQFDYQDPGLLGDVHICKSICRKLITSEGSKFLIAPLSSQRYIKHSELGIFVILDDKKISVINHEYYYSNILLSNRDWDKLTKMYDTKVERIRQELKNEMKSQIKYSLKGILDRVDNSKKLKTPTE
jgi:hypothetical protein